MEIYFYDPEAQSLGIKPPPDVYDLFTFYNHTFFFDVLDACQLKWSKRMTLCAGTCQYSSLNSCTITLSQPLLQYRSNNEIKETLIHEMIHAYLFLTDPSACKESGGHGKEFQQLMEFINGITGLSITVYHSFHEEVDQMRVHIWKCDGKCVENTPYFGMVKRAMNRAPGPTDNWWGKHQRECGGKFIKIDGPEFREGAEKKKEKNVKKKKNNRKITEFLNKKEDLKKNDEDLNKNLEKNKENSKGNLQILSKTEDLKKNKEILNKNQEKSKKNENYKENGRIFRFKFVMFQDDNKEMEVLRVLLSDQIQINALYKIISSFFIEFSIDDLFFLNLEEIQTEKTLFEAIVDLGIQDFLFFYLETVQFSLNLEFIYDVTPTLNQLVLEAYKSPKVFGVIDENLDFDQSLLKFDNKTKINEKLKVIS